MIEHLLNRRLDVYRTVNAPDGAGGQSSTVAQVGTVRARVSQPRAAERVVAEQAGSRHDHIVHLSPRDDVRRGDVLRPAGAPAGSRPFLKVISTTCPSEPVYLRVECELVQPEG